MYFQRTPTIALCLMFGACAKLPAYFHIIFDPPEQLEGSEDSIAVFAAPLGDFDAEREDRWLGAGFSRVTRQREQRQLLNDADFSDRLLIRYEFPTDADGSVLQNLGVEFCLFERPQDSIVGDTPCFESDTNDRRATWFIESPFYENKETSHVFNLRAATFERGLPSQINRLSKCEVRGCITGDPASNYCVADTQKHPCEAGSNEPQ